MTEEGEATMGNENGGRVLEVKEGMDEERERCQLATILWYTPMYLARYTPININTHIKFNPSLIESAN